MGSALQTLHLKAGLRSKPDRPDRWYGLVLTLVTLLSLYLGRGRGVLGEHELILSERGLIESTEYNETLHKWNGLGFILVTHGYYFVRTNETNGGYHLIPRRGHILEGDPESFVAELRARVATHAEVLV